MYTFTFAFIIFRALSQSVKSKNANDYMHAYGQDTLRTIPGGGIFKKAN